MGKSSATGSFYLLIGVAVSSVIMAVGTIVLARILPVASDYGLYGAALIPSSIINFFRDWGVNSAMTKKIASLRGNGKESEIHDVIVSGVLFELISGASLSLLCFILSGFFASILNAPEASLFISIMSLSILGGAILTAASSIFVGFERMKLNSFTLICQALVKTVVGPFLVIIGYGVLGATIGYVSSYLAGGLIGISGVYFVLFRSLQKSNVGKRSVATVLKPMLEFGAPLMVSNIVIGVLPLLLNSLMVIYTGPSMYGNYLVALNFAVLLTFVTIPINTVLFPAFSKINVKEDSNLAQTVFASSVKYTAIFLVPLTLAIMVLSTPMVNALFGYLPAGGPKYSFAPVFLTLYVIINLFAVVGSLSVGNFLAGVGKTKILMYQGFLTLSIGLPLAFIMIPVFGVVGGILTSIISTVPSLSFVLYWVWKHYRVKADFKASIKIIWASLIAAVAAYLAINVIGYNDWLRLAVGIAVFLVLYLVSAPLTDAIKQTDIDNLRAMFSGLGVISKILEIPLRIMEKFAGIRHNKGIAQEVS